MAKKVNLHAVLATGRVASLCLDCFDFNPAPSYWPEKGAEDGPMP